MPHNKQKGIKLISYFQFFSYVAIIAFIALTLANYLFYRENFDTKLKQNNKNNSKILISELNQSVLYAENFATFIGRRIALNKNNTKEFIASVLLDAKTRVDNQKHDIFTWTLFDFVDPNGYVIAASTTGVAENPTHITKEKRSWVETAKKEAWTLFNSKPDIGVSSREPIIPFGIGITSKDNNFLGIISFGVNTDKLRDKLQSAISDNVAKFTIFDQDFNFILSSQNFEQNEIIKIREYLLQSKNDIKSNKSLVIESKIYYFNSSNSYPFYFVVGSNENAVNQEFWLQFFPKISNTLYLTIFFLVLLYFFRSKLLNPVMNLSEVTNKISRKDFSVLVPGSDIYEINVLADSIREVKYFLKQEEKEKEKLKKQKDKAEQENLGKTEFLSATVHDFKNHLIAILGASDLVRTNLNEKFSNKNLTLTQSEAEENIGFLNNITSSAEELSSMVSDILDINQASTGNFKISAQDQVDMGSLVLRTVNLLVTRAARNNQKLLCNIDSTSEKIIGSLLDPMRVKQILANLISNAVKYSTQNSKIEVLVRQLKREECLKVHDEIMHKITKNYELDNKTTDHLSITVAKKLHNRVSIIIKDQGFGMDEDEIKIALSRYGVVHNQNSNKVDSTGLGLPIVKYLVEVQGGLMKIRSEKGEGTEVEIIL